MVLPAHQRHRQVHHLPVVEPLLQRLGHRLLDVVLVAVKQLVVGHGGGEAVTGAPGQRFDPQLDDGPAGLGHGVGGEAPPRLGRGLPVDDGGRREGGLQPVALLQQDLQHLQLDGAGDAQLHLLGLGDIGEIQQRVLLGELRKGQQQRAQGLPRPGGYVDGEHRMGEGGPHQGTGLADDMGDAGVRQAAQAHDVAGRRLLHLHGAAAGKPPDLGHLAVAARQVHRVAGGQAAAE